MPRSEDLKGQREALTEDVDDSGGEKDAPGENKTTQAKAQKTMLRDSAMPVVMIAGFFITFGALAATAIFVVSRAFGNGVEGVGEIESALGQEPLAAPHLKINATRL